MKRILAMIMALMFFPALAVAAAQLSGTVVKVDKDKKQIVLKTEKGEETLEFTSSTKGAENAKEGAKVTVKYSQKGEKLVASEIEGSKADPKTPPSKGSKGDPKSSPFDKPSKPGLPPMEPR